MSRSVAISSSAYRIARKTSETTISNEVVVFVFSNAGIGITLVRVQKGYGVVIVMMENMSEERKNILALGAGVILTKVEESIGG